MNTYLHITAAVAMTLIIILMCLSIYTFIKEELKEKAQKKREDEWTGKAFAKRKARSAKMSGLARLLQNAKRPKE